MTDWRLPNLDDGGGQEHGGSDDDCVWRHGCFYRDEHGPVLYLGTLNQPRDSAEAAHMAKVFPTIRSATDIYKHFISIAQSDQPTSAWRDYWPWWRQNAEVAEAGKMLLVRDGDLPEQVIRNLPCVGQVYRLC